MEDRKHAPRHVLLIGALEGGLSRVAPMLQRAEFDVHYDRNKTVQWQIFSQGSALGSRQDDQRIFNGVLSLLYVARRQNPESGGLGSLHLERMLGVPREHLEFPLWVLKKRGWIEVLDTGQVAITVEGIDMVIAEDLAPPDDRLLTELTVEPDEPADEVELRAAEA